MGPKKKDDKNAEDQGKEDVGVYHFPDGSKYDGQVNKKEGGAVKRHGYGLYFDVGTVYDGQWVDDEMHGEGTLKFDTGANYVGTFFHNVFSGKGKYLWADGSFYDGLWRANKMHGEGVFVDIHGRRWTGKFYDGQGPGLVQEVS